MVKERDGLAAAGHDFLVCLSQWYHNLPNVGLVQPRMVHKIEDKRLRTQMRRH